LTFTSPIFGSDSRPLLVIFQRALAVNRMACRESLRDLKRGARTRFPLRSPFNEAKKFLYAASTSRKACCRTTDDTSASQERSGVFFARVINRWDRTAAPG